MSTDIQSTLAWKPVGSGSLELIDWLNWDFLQGRFASCFLFFVPCFLPFSSYKRSKCVSSTRNYLFSSAWIEYEKDGVSLLVIILHCQSQVCMAWTGLVNQLLFLSYSHDKWGWRLLPSSVDKSMLYWYPDNSAKDRSANDTSAKPGVRMPTVRRDNSANETTVRRSSVRRSGVRMRL